MRKWKHGDSLIFLVFFRTSFSTFGNDSRWDFCTYKMLRKLSVINWNSGTIVTVFFFFSHIKSALSTMWIVVYCALCTVHHPLYNYLCISVMQKNVNFNDRDQVGWLGVGGETFDVNEKRISIDSAMLTNKMQCYRNVFCIRGHMHFHEMCNEKWIKTKNP